MSTLFCLLLLSSGPLGDLPRTLAQAEPVQEETLQEEPEAVLEGLPEIGWKVSVAALWSDFDEDIHLEEGTGGFAELQVRFDDVYYYKLGVSLVETETEDLPVNEDVDIFSWYVGLGMDVLFGAFDMFALDVGVAGGITDYDSRVDDDEAWFLQVEVVARVQPVDLVSVRGGVEIDFVNTSFRAQETEHITNWSAFVGVEITY